MAHKEQTWTIVLPKTFGHRNLPLPLTHVAHAYARFRRMLLFLDFVQHCISREAMYGSFNVRREHAEQVMFLRDAVA